jgi:hypothetical protein
VLKRSSSPLLLSSIFYLPSDASFCHLAEEKAVLKLLFDLLVCQSCMDRLPQIKLSPSPSCHLSSFQTNFKLDRAQMMIATGSTAMSSLQIIYRL